MLKIWGSYVGQSRIFASRRITPGVLRSVGRVRSITDYWLHFTTEFAQVTGDSVDGWPVWSILKCRRMLAFSTWVVDFALDFLNSVCSITW